MAVSPPPLSSLSPLPSSPGAGPSNHSESKTFRRLRTSLNTIRATAGGVRTRTISTSDSSSKNSPSSANPPPTSTATPTPATRSSRMNLSPTSLLHPTPGSQLLTPAKQLRHKPSASESNLLHPIGTTISTTTAAAANSPHSSQDAAAAGRAKEKSKHRASVDFVGVGEGAVRERERDRARFGRLRKLESKVGLRRLGSKESPGAAKHEKWEDLSRSRSSEAPATTATTKSKRRKDKEKQQHEHEREKEQQEGQPSRGGRIKSAWSFQFLAPSLSHASSSTSALSADVPGPPDTDPPPIDTKDVTPHGPRPPTPPSPTPPPKHSPSSSSSPSSRARAALTSPSTPSLSSSQATAKYSPPTPTRSTAAAAASPPPSSPISPRIRPRPAPLQTQANHPLSASHTQSSSLSSSMLSSSSSHSPSPASSQVLGRSTTMIQPQRSSPSSPTLPSTPKVPKTSSPAVPIANPSPSSPVRTSSPSLIRQSRPPLSPSANANSRMRLRAASGRSVSATNLPLGPGGDGDTAELERSVSSLTGSSQGERGRETERERGRGGGAGAVEITKSEKPERPERSEKRRSGGSINTTTTTTSAAAGAGGRTTPTTGGVPSFAQPTSSSRARQTPSITRGRDRDREENATKDISHYRDTRSRASASTPSLALPELEPIHQRDRERSPSKATTTATNQARTPARRVSLPPTVRTTSPTPTNSHATSRASTPKRAVSPTPIPNESAILDEDEDDVIEVNPPVVVAVARELENKRRPQAIQLGKGKWPDDFMNAFSSPPSPSRPVAIHRAEAENTLSSNTQSSPLVITKNNNTGSSPISVPHRPMHRPRHSIDAPILRPKNQSPSPDGVHARIVPRRHSTSANRHGIYIPRSNSPSPDVNGIGLGLGNASGGTSVPFPRAVSGEHAAASPGLGVGVIAGASPSEVSATAAAATAAQQSRLTRGRFQSEVDAGTRGRPRPNSYDELGGGRPRRSRIESMVSIGGASSSNFSASDIRSSMDGGNVRKTLIIKDEGRPATHFQLGNCIGRGQFGSVYRALNLNTGQMVAVKRIRLEGLSEDDVKQLMQEVDMLKSLSHPGIVKYEGMSRDSDTLNIVLEYAENGSLGQTLKAFGKLNEKLVATYVIKILEGLDYLHRNDVVHCDLKAANILTTKTGNVKLSDFGVSLNLRKVGRDHKADVTGTPNWMAPEVIELKGASPGSDIWSLGCTVIELLTGKPPYAEIQNGMSVMYRIVDDPMPPIPDEWSPPLRDFLLQCFRREPSDRPNAEVLCEHEWLKEHCEIHQVLRPKESIPFLRRVSLEVQRSPDVRFQGVVDAAIAPRSDSRASSERPRQSFDRSSPSPSSPAPAPAHVQGLPGSPPKKRMSSGPGPGPVTPKSPDHEASPSPSPSPLAREHSFVKTAFGKPLPCAVCSLSVQKGAVVCETCSLIAHSRCAPNATAICGWRAQLLQFANNYSPPPESIELLRQFTPGSSPIATDSAFPIPIPGSNPIHANVNAIQPNTPTTPVSFKMFNAFRRSRSSLTTDPNSPRALSADGHRNSSGNGFGSSSGNGNGNGSRNENGNGNGSGHGNGNGNGSSSPRPRPNVLLKPAHARPLSTTSSESNTPNRSSVRSGVTSGGSGSVSVSVDLSDESVRDSQSQGHGHGHSNSQSRRESSMPSSPLRLLSRSRSRGRSRSSVPSGSSLGHGAIHEPMPEGSVSSGVGGDNSNEVEMGLGVGAGAGDEGEEEERRRRDVSDPRPISRPRARLGPRPSSPTPLPSPSPVPVPIQKSVPSPVRIPGVNNNNNKNNNNKNRFSAADSTDPDPTSRVSILAVASSVGDQDEEEEEEHDVELSRLGWRRARRYEVNRSSGGGTSDKEREKEKGCVLQ